MALCSNSLLVSGCIYNLAKGGASIGNQYAPNCGEGVLLKPVGFPASGGDSTFVSVFLDVPTPKMERYDCRGSKHERCNVTGSWVQSTLSQHSYNVERNVSLMHYLQVEQATELRAETMAECMSQCANNMNRVKLAYNGEIKRCRINHGYPYEKKLTRLILDNYDKRGIQPSIGSILIIP